MTHEAPVMIALGPLAVVALVALGLFLLIRGRRLGHVVGRTAYPRHIVTRIVCGTLGAAILIAIGIGSWLSANRCYAPVSPDGVKISVPTQDPPPLPAAKPGYRTEVAKARLLYHLVIGETAPDGFHPVHAEEIDIRWPRDKGRHLQRVFEVGDYSCTIRVQPTRFFARRSDKEAQSCLEPQGSVSFTYRHGMGSGSVGTGFQAMEADHLTSLRHLGPFPNPLSVTPGGPPGNRLHAVYFLTRADEADPLKSIPYAAFADDRPEELAKIIREATRNTSHYRSLGNRDIPARCFALTEQIGLSSLLLFAAAILLAQLFRRRGLAFAGVLAAVVLYVAALERVALGVHVSKLSDSKASLASRLTASEMAPQTFFHAERAYAALLEVAKDASAPRPLRSATVKGARELFPQRALPEGCDPS